MSKKHVPANVFLKCDKGVTPCRLQIVRPGPNLYDEKWAVESDALPVVNVASFGVCAITHAPCVPATVRWQNPLLGSTKIVAMGMPQNPLMDDSFLPCTLGGKIDIFFTRAAVTQALADDQQEAAAKKVAEEAKAQAGLLLFAAIAVAVVVVVATGGAALPLVAAAAATGAVVGGGVGAVAGGMEGYAHGGTMGAVKGAADGLLMGAVIGAVGGAAAVAGGPASLALMEASGAMFGLATAADAFAFYKKPTLANGLVLASDLVVLFGAKVIEAKANEIGGQVEEGVANRTKGPAELEATSGPAKRQCTKEGDPVDVAGGAMFFDAVDVELPGPIPFVWERTWYSTSVRNGPLGHGWHHGYDLALLLDHAGGTVAMRLDDGRPAIFELPGPDNDYAVYYRPRKLELRPLPTGEDGYAVLDLAAGFTYRFTPASHQPDQYSLAAIEDNYGHALRFAYSAEGHLQGIVDSVGRPIGVQTDGAGRILALTLPLPDGSAGHFTAVQYAYDEAGNMTAVTNAEGHAMRFAYRGRLLVQKTFATGMSFYFEYDAQHRCTRTWGDEGYYDCRFTYRPGHTTVSSPEPAATQEYYHERGLVTLHVNAVGAHHHFRYNAFDELEAEQDALGHTIRYEHDDKGQLAEIIYPDGVQVTTRYDEEGRPVEHLDANGNPWRWQYDESGDLLVLTDPAGHLATHQYDAQGNLTEVTDELGKVMRLRYDAQSYLRHLVTADDQLLSRQYDALGRLVQLTDALGQAEVRRYDRMGRLVAVRERDGSESRVRYDGDGNVVWAQDAQQTVEFEYTAVDRVAVRRQAGRSVQFTYDRQARLIGLRNELGQRYRFGLDAAGQVVEEEGYDGLRRRYERDAAGRVAAVHRPGNRTTAYHYNPAGRVAAIAYHDGTAEHYAYAPDGTLVEARNAATTVQFERDALGRVLTETQGHHTVTSAYNARSRRTALESSLGLSLALSYNAAGHVAAMRANGWQGQFERDGRGLEIQRQLSGGLRMYWQRDAVGRPTSQQVQTPLARRQRRYHWQVADQLTAIDDTATGLARFTHDAFGALERVVEPDGQVELRQSDATDHLFRSPAQTDRTYAPGGQLRRADGTRYRYDEEGNRVRKITADGRVWTYAWTAAGQLAAVTLPNGYAVAFAYDALNRRIRKRYRGRVTHWVWDGDKILHEWQTLEISADADSIDDLATWLFEERSFAPVAKLTAAGAFNVLADHLGTPLALYDSQGATTWQAELDAYGAVRQGRGNPQDCPFRYPGQYEDVETGLYYNRFRYYDPEVGHYLSQDPLGLAGGPALYAYVADPLTQTDVLGLSKGSGTLGKNLVKAGQTHGISGFNKGDFQAHHVIPHETWTQNQSFFDDIGLGKNGRTNPKDAAANGVFLPKNETIGANHGFDYYHNGSHPNINTDMTTEVGNTRLRYEQGTITKLQARKEISALQKAERRRLSTRGGGPCGKAS